MKIERRTCARLLHSARRAAVALGLAAALAACGGGADGGAGHQHGPGEGDHHHGEEEALGVTAAKTDAHHAAENRTQCEDDVALTHDALARYGIQVEPVGKQTLVPTVSAPGHLAFPQGAVARVGSAVTGRIAEIRVRSGDALRRGDPLIVVESPELGEAQSDYLQKRTIAATAGPSLELVRDALQGARELHESVQGIALAEVREREIELRAAEREREVARAAETAARNRLLLLGMGEQEIAALEGSGQIQPRFTIAAPIEGNVVEIAATLGELVGPQKDRLLVIGDLRTLWAIAEVSESRLAEVELGAAARVSVPALGSATTAGVVAALPTVLEAETRTAEVRVELPNPDGSLLPGMFIQVEIDSSLGPREPVLAVPDGAVLTIEGEPSVFVALEPGSSAFCRHPVEVGAPIGELLPVLAGLAPGELVVVAGTFRLKAELGKASAKHEH